MIVSKLIPGSGFPTREAIVLVPGAFHLELWALLDDVKDNDA